MRDEIVQAGPEGHGGDEHHDREDGTEDRRSHGRGIRATTGLQRESQSGGERERNARRSSWLA